jgi:hypothetical protein
MKGAHCERTQYHEGKTATSTGEIGKQNKLNCDKNTFKHKENGNTLGKRRRPLYVPGRLTGISTLKVNH